jgi:hypothetical protein
VQEALDGESITASYRRLDALLDRRGCLLATNIIAALTVSGIVDRTRRCESEWELYRPDHPHIVTRVAHTLVLDEQRLDLAPGIDGTEQHRFHAEVENDSEVETAMTRGSAARRWVSSDRFIEVLL